MLSFLTISLHNHATQLIYIGLNDLRSEIKLWRQNNQFDRVIFAPPLSTMIQCSSYDVCDMRDNLCGCLKKEKIACSISKSRVKIAKKLF